jgi:hypothetical protein
VDQYGADDGKRRKEAEEGSVEVGKNLSAIVEDHGISPFVCALVGHPLLLSVGRPRLKFF